MVLESVVVVFFKYFLLGNILKLYFYFKKISFDISISKLSENIKKINLKLRIFLKKNFNYFQKRF